MNRSVQVTFCLLPYNGLLLQGHIVKGVELHWFEWQESRYTVDKRREIRGAVLLIGSTLVAGGCEQLM